MSLLELKMTSPLLNRTAAVAGHDGSFCLEAGVIAKLVFPALDVDVRPEGVQQLTGGRMRVDVDEVDRFQGCEVLRPKFLGDIRRVGPFIDLGVAGEGDDQDIPLALGKVQVADVAGVHDVKTAVAVDDAPVGLPSGIRAGEAVPSRLQF